MGRKKKESPSISDIEGVDNKITNSNLAELETVVNGLVKANINILCSMTLNILFSEENNFEKEDIKTLISTVSKTLFKPTEEQYPPFFIKLEKEIEKLNSLYIVYFPYLSAIEKTAGVDWMYRQAFKTFYTIIVFYVKYKRNKKIKDEITETLSPKELEKELSRFQKFLETIIDNTDMYYKMSQEIENGEEAETKQETAVINLKQYLPENYNYLSTSPAFYYLKLILQTMGHNKKRGVAVNRNIEFVDYTLNGKYTATFDKKATTQKIVVTIDDIHKVIAGKNKTLIKLFNFILMKANRYALNNDISFKLQELVDYGIYSSIESARISFLKGTDTLMTIQLEIEKRTNKRVAKNEKLYLFTYRKIENNFCTVTINEKFNLELLKEFFTIIPNWMFSLKDKAFSIADYIFYLARMNSANIKENGSFNVNFNVLSNYLNLPLPNETKHHRQLIISPILEAITEIEEKQEQNNELQISFEICPSNEFKNVYEFLSGYLKVNFTKGQVKTYFSERATEYEKELEKCKERREKALLEIEKKNLEKNDKPNS